MSHQSPSGSSAASQPEITGSPIPRIAVPEPARELTPDTSYGYDVIEFARQLGEPLLPWEEEVVKRVLEIDEATGLPRFRKAVIMAARQNGKSRTACIITLWRMLQFARPQLILGTAQDVAQASYAWNLALQLVRGCPWLRQLLGFDRHVNGQESFGFTNGSEYKIRASNEAAGRGLSTDMLLLDELRTHRSWGAYAAQVNTTLAKPGSLVLAMSNAGDVNAVVLNHLRSIGLAGGDPQMLWLEWSAPDGCDPSDPAMWALANPSLGHLISLQTLQSMYDSTPLNIFRPENLCQYVEHLDNAIDAAAWAACEDKTGTLDGQRGRISAGFDTAPDDKHATLCVAARLPDGRVRVEVAGFWDSTSEARGALVPLLDRIQPVAIAWYPPSELAPILRARPGSTELTGGKVAEAAMGLAGAVAARELVHGGQSLLDAHVAAAERVTSGDGGSWKFTRKGGTGHVDGAYAAAAAVQLALTAPPDDRPRIRILDW